MAVEGDAAEDAGSVVRGGPDESRDVPLHVLAHIVHAAAAGGGPSPQPV